MDVLALHRDLVAIPSVSGEERAIADYVEARLGAYSVERVDNTVIASVGEGPVVVLNSHHDTVPPQEGWQADPWVPRLVDGKVIGLGANDAKASVAAMMAAFTSWAEAATNFQLVLLLAEGEETLGEGTQKGLQHLEATGRKPKVAVIGEPTRLESGIGQYGLAVMRLVATGQPCHAAHARRLGIRNPIWTLAADLRSLEEADIGNTTVEPTVLEGAQARNQVPGLASAILDVRLAPTDSAAIVASALQDRVQGKIEILSDRLIPYAYPSGCEALLQCFPKPHFLSRTMSDQVFFQDVPAVKIGPGVTERSHTVEEFVLESEIEAGVAMYQQILKNLAEVLN